MTVYLVRRFFQSLAFIAVAAIGLYTFLVFGMRDGPYQQYIHPERFRSVFNIVDPADLVATYKLDAPWPACFFLWLFDPNDTTQLDSSMANTIPKGIDVALGDLHIKGSGILTGDWGKSDWIARGRPVTELIGDRWVNSVGLVGLSLLLSVLVALPLGIYSAVRHHSAADHTITFLSFAGLSMPSFVLGLLFIMLLSVMFKQWHDQFNWSWLLYLPAGSVYGAKDTLLDHLYHLVLPVLTLVIPQVAWLSRYVRFSMLDVLRQDYIRTAWAKGLPAWRVIFKHAFRNALIPVITAMGLALPALATSAIVVETVFAYGGMGQLYYRSLGGCLATQSTLLSDTPPCAPLGNAPDYPLALVLTVMLITIVAFSNMLADMVYAAADPRINYGART